MYSFLYKLTFISINIIIKLKNKVREKMNIINDYEGASIDIIKNDKNKNKVYLSLKKEKDKYSYYYNFVIENEEKTEGEVRIDKISSSQYYTKGRVITPYIKENTWQRLNKEKFYIDGDELVIKIAPNTKQEISLVPRYTQDNLEKFIKKIPKNKIKIKDTPINEIIIGEQSLPAVFIIARQHPGETLSSFFVEGVIEELIETNKLLNKYCFIIYPIVNQKGVANGNHRYTENIDYNRCWNKKNAPKEIQYIKKQLEKNKPKYFVDVHNDEITKESYIRAYNKINIRNNIAGIRVLDRSSKIRRFVRALIKQRKIINLCSKTANEYIYHKYKCNTFLVEISMEENRDFKEIGKEFIKDLIK